MDQEPYIPEEQTGAGPSAKVYRAHDSKGLRTVRLKVLLSGLESRYAVDREHLADRVASLKEIDHPQAGRLLDLDIQGDDMTLVTDYAEGLNGWEFIGRRTLSVAELRSLAVQLMSALQAGEATRTAHGDVKPSNLILSRREGIGPVLHLQDWGVAQSRHEQPRETLQFRAPELGPEDPATMRADLYSAAASLTALAVGAGYSEACRPGQPPRDWRALVEARWQAHGGGEVAFKKWLLWLLQPEAAGRPRSATEALKALNGAAAGTASQMSAGMVAASLLCNAAVIGTLAGYVLWLLRGRGG